MRRLLCLLLLVGIALPSLAAEDPKSKAAGEEAAIESTVLAVYNVISGPAGPRDWDRFRGLFAPGARLVSVRDGKANVMKPDDYVTRATPSFEKNGFFERPVETKVDRFRDIVHVSSRYESRHAATDEKPFATGVNHFELVKLGDRWQVLSIVWQQE